MIIRFVKFGPFSPDTPLEYNNGRLQTREGLRGCSASELMRAPGGLMKSSLEGRCELVIMILRAPILIHLTWMWFCEGKRQHFDELLPLHQRDGSIHLHQRNHPLPYPTLPHPPPLLSAVSPWPWRLACLIKQETRTKKQKNNRRLWQLFKAFHRLRHKLCVRKHHSDAEFLLAGRCTFTTRSRKDWISLLCPACAAVLILSTEMCEINIYKYVKFPFTKWQ